MIVSGAPQYCCRNCDSLLTVLYKLKILIKARWVMVQGEKGQKMPTSHRKQLFGGARVTLPWVYYTVLTVIPPVFKPINHSLKKCIIEDRREIIIVIKYHSKAFTLIILFILKIIYIKFKNALALFYVYKFRFITRES